MGKYKTPIYDVARTVVGTSKEISAAREIHVASGETLAKGLEAYGGISKLEDKYVEFAAKLRESEENLKNDLGGGSFFKKKMDIRKYWDVGELEKFGDFENVVGTNYADKFIGDVYAKLNKKGDVLVNEELLKNGVVKLLPEEYLRKTKYKERLVRAQKYAKKNKLGLWGK